MYTTIQKWGNNQAVCLPKFILDAVFFHENDTVEVSYSENVIILKKVKHETDGKKNIEKRLEAFYNRPIDDILSDETLYNPTEYDWGAKTGNEVW